LSEQDLLKEQNVDYSVFSDMVDHSTGQSAFLPLELFDDITYECRDPEDWVRLGTSDGTLTLCDAYARACVLMNASNIF
jgi:hypothetical protein